MNDRRINRRKRGSKQRLFLERLESRRLLAADLLHSNPHLPTDVDASGSTTPRDSLIITNYINANGARRLEPTTPTTGFVDVNRDGYVTPGDSLAVINYINRNGANDPPIVGFDLFATDLAGNPLPNNTMKVGEDAVINVAVTDLRSTFLATGVFAAYLDVGYDNADVFSIVYGEVQRLSISNNATFGGTFTLMYEGAISEPISFGSNFDEATANIQAALEGLPALNPGDIEVTHTPDNDPDNPEPLIWEVRFVGDKRATDVPLMGIDTSQLTPTGQVDGTVETVAPADINNPETFRKSFKTGELYPNGLTAKNGNNEIDEAGAFDGNGIPDETEFHTVFTFVIQADERGEVTFLGNPAEEAASAVLVFGSDEPVDIGLVDYGQALTIIIEQPVNAVDDTFDQINEDTDDNPLDVLANDFLESGSTGNLALDPNGLGTPDQGGTVTVSGNQILYSPADDFFGTETFTYTAIDGLGNSDVATVTVTVDNVNDPPVANDDAFTVDEDTVDNTFDVLQNDTTPANENETLTIIGVGETDQGGTVTFTETEITYTPAGDFFGTETFTYTISDGNGEQDSATVTVTVNNVNDDPDAQDDSFTAVEDSEDNLFDVLANDSIEPDAGETLTITSVTQGDQGGTVAIVENQVSYTPAGDFFGTETFTYTISDGNGGSATATVTVEVENVNDDPTANDDEFFVDEFTTDNELDVLQNDSIEPDAGETLTITSVSTPDVGTASTDGSVILYSPPADQLAPFTAEFTYTISDGNGGTATANVTVNVEPVIRPRARDDRFTVSEDSQDNAFDVMGNDLFNDGAVREITRIVTQPENGTVTLDDNQTPDDTTDDFLVYTPNGDFFGTDTFEYEIDDDFVEGEVPSSPDVALVTVTVENVNDDPQINDDNFTVDEDSENNLLDVLANDSFAPDPTETLTITSVSAGSANGSVSIVNNQISYTPVADFFGTETFTYAVSDGNGGSGEATVTVTVENVNDDPTAVADAFTIQEDSGANALDVLVNDTIEPDVNETLTITSVSNAAHGDVAIVSGSSLTYTPDDDFFGEDSFTYTISDGNGGTSTATVSLTVENVNDDPTANDDSAFAIKNFTDQEVDVLANDTDAPDVGETLTIISLGTPNRGGAVRVEDGIVLYSPATDFEGFETFTYTISDGNGGEDSGTVTVEVVEAVPSDISGTIYFDANNNGVQDDGELAIGGAEVMIYGVNLRGETYEATITTDAKGGYVFEDVLPSLDGGDGYTIKAMQVEMTLDGRDTIGHQGGDDTVNDEFSGIDLDIFGTDNANENLFGELGVRPEFITIAELFAKKTNQGLIVATNISSQDQYWYSILEGWDGVTSAQMVLAEDLTSVEVTIGLEGGGQQTRTIPTTSPHFRIMGHDKGEGYILRIDGTAEDLGFDLVAGDQPEGEGQQPANEVPAVERQGELLLARARYAKAVDAAFDSWS